MSKYKLHHTKFYTLHSAAETGKLHCYRCNEILELGAKVMLQKKDGGFVLPFGVSTTDDDGGMDLDDDGDVAVQGEYVYMGSLCALKAIAGR